ncbi:MAG: hypothetical protein ACTSRA_08530 [Promethearchaeota archaeon]
MTAHPATPSRIEKVGLTIKQRGLMSNKKIKKLDVIKCYLLIK